MAEPIGPKPGSTGGNGRLSLPWEAPSPKARNVQVVWSKR